MFVGILLVALELDWLSEPPSFEKLSRCQSEEEDVWKLKKQNRNVEKDQAGQFGVEETFPKNVLSIEIDNSCISITL